MIIKRARIFSVEIEGCTQQRLAELLKEQPARDPKELETEVSGFCHHPMSAELVTPIGKGDLAFCVRTDKKVIPAAAVKLKAAKIASEMAVQLGEPLTRKQRLEATERAMREMLPTAFVQQRITFCYYSPSSKLLVIDTASKGVAETVMNLILRVVGSVKTSTIHIDGIKQSLATKLRSSLSEDSVSIGPFDAGDKINLVGWDGEHVQYKGIDPLYQEELLSHLKAGYQIEKIALTDGTTSFNLHSDFRLSAIRFDRVEDQEDTPYDDDAGNWRIHAGAEFTLLMGAVKSICELFMPQSEDLIGGTA